MLNGDYMLINMLVLRTFILMVLAARASYISFTSFVPVRDI
jgi:hypothetical protein